jgi:acetyl esterase/lipase
MRELEHPAITEVIMRVKKTIFLITSLFFACGSRSHKAPGPPLGYPNFTLLKIAVALKLEKLVEVKPPVPDSIAALTDLIYKKIGERELGLDLYRLKSLSRPAPTLIFIHGGAWKSGNKRDYLAYLLPFAAKGYVTATVAYRFSQEAGYPAAVQDVQCAVRWLKRHSLEYGIDSSRIALIGGSAGGHLAMMVGYSADQALFNDECAQDSVSSRVQAVVNIYGPCDLTTLFAINNGVVIKFIGQTYDQAAERYRQASPLTYLSRDDPATLIFHGTIDDVVPISQSDTLKSRLDRLGIDNEYHRLRGWPHTMDLSKRVNAYCFYYMDAFFRKHL